MSQLTNLTTQIRIYIYQRRGFFSLISLFRWAQCFASAGRRVLHLPGGVFRIAQTFCQRIAKDNLASEGEHKHKPWAHK